MKFIVEIGWREEYEFDNADAAMAFAIIASTHRSDGEASDVKIIIKVDRDA